MKMHRRKLKIVCFVGVHLITVEDTDESALTQVNPALTLVAELKTTLFPLQSPNQVERVVLWRYLWQSERVVFKRPCPST